MPELLEARVGAPQVTVIEVFADVVCPFAHAGLRAVAARRAALGRADVVLRIRAWPLELVNSGPLDPDETAEHVADLRAQVAPDLFRGFDAGHFPVTSLPALALAAEAYRVDDTTGEAVSFALRDALFEEGRDISAPDVLASIGAAFGLSAEDEASSADVIIDWRQGQARGVQGSPHFFCGDLGAFCPGLRISPAGDGHVHVARNTEKLDQFLQRCLAEG